MEKGCASLDTWRQEEGGLEPMPFAHKNSGALDRWRRNIITFATGCFGVIGMTHS